MGIKNRLRGLGIRVTRAWRGTPEQLGELEGEFNRLLDSMRGGNGDKKT